MRRLLLALVLLCVTFATSAWALTPDANGWYHTGDSVRTKTFLKVKVYGIGHDMKCLPAAKTKQSMIDTDCDKKFTLAMKHDIDKAKFTDALKEAYALNNYNDAGKINQALAAISADIVDGKTTITISYNSAAKTTTFTESNGGGTATVAGADFMKGTWSIWFGKIDPSSMSDELMSKL